MSTLQPVGVCRWFDEPQDEDELRAEYQAAGYTTVTIRHYVDGNGPYAWARASRPHGYKSEACIYAGWRL